MGKSRIEAFSDGVLAVIITIMVLNLKVPHGEGFTALSPVLPVFLTYVLSFLYIAIYWNNHHHMLHTIERVNGAILWANMHLLFWLSLFPFATGWVGENHSASAPMAFYGFVMFMAALAYYALQQTIIAAQGAGSLLAKAVGRDLKGKASPLLYGTAIAAAFFQPWVAAGIYLLVALMWLVPDRRIERIMVPAVLLFALSPASASPKVEWPEGTETEYVSKFANLPFRLQKKTFHLGLDETGRPVLQIEDMFIPLKLHKEEPTPTPFQPKGMKVDAFAYTGPGQVLVVSGDALMVPTDKGPRTVLNLPYKDMKVAAYGGGSALVYGGKAVYLYKPDHAAQAATLYLNVPGGVEALAAGKDYAIIASHGVIYLFKPGQAPVKLADAGEPVLSIALGPAGGLFFSTEDGLFFSSPDGHFKFGRHKGTVLASTSDTLFVLFPGEGVMMCMPTFAFANKARSLDKPAKKR